MKKKIKNIVIGNTSQLHTREKNFESIYDIIFGNQGIAAETSDGYRVTEHTFSDVRKTIERVSAGIYEKIGATGCYVGLDMENCLQWVVSFWAILRSGNKPYLVNTRHPLKLSNDILKTLDIKYVISLSTSSLSAETLIYDELDCDNPFDGAFENEMALSTSATSLKETICIYSGYEICNQLLNVLDFIYKHPEISESCEGKIKQLAFLPFYHIFGFIAVYLWFSFFGQIMVFLPDLSANTIMRTCRKQKVTHVFAVPLLWHTIEKEVNKKLTDEKTAKKFRHGIKLCTAIQNVFPRLGMRLSQKIMSRVTDELMGDSIRFCINGGSYIKPSTLEMLNGLGYSLHNGYGMSEIGITSVELRSKPKHLNRGSIGKPFKSVEYRINENGVLEVKGCSICKRIIRDGEVIDVNESYVTGDKMTEKDGYYFILGREGDMVLGENGENINPDVLEQTFTLPYANNLSVLGLGNNHNEELSLVVEINKFTSFDKIKETAAQAYSCAQALSKEYTIKKFYFTKDPLMPPSAVKVSRKYLKNAVENGTVQLIPFSDAEAKGSSTEAANSELYAEVTAILAELLDIPPETIDKDAHILFDLGASSINYFTFISLLSEKFGVDTSDLKTTDCYTVTDFCNCLERYI